MSEGKVKPFWRKKKKRGGKNLFEKRGGAPTANHRPAMALKICVVACFGGRREGGKENLESWKAVETSSSAKEKTTGGRKAG